jgi:uncharacterized protein YlxW (UPF0749 family)
MVKNQVSEKKVREPKVLVGRREFVSFKEKAAAFWMVLAAIQFVLLSVVGSVDRLQEKGKNGNRKRQKRVAEKVKKLREASDIWYAEAAATVYYGFGINLNLVNVMQIDIERIQKGPTEMERECRKLIKKTREAEQARYRERIRESLGEADITVIRDIVLSTPGNGIKITVDKNSALRPKVKNK